MRYLLQSGDYLRKEKSAVMREDADYFSVSYDDLAALDVAVRNQTVPVGSVEFVTKYAELNGIALPKNISYPTELSGYLGRSIWQSIFARAKPNEFVKPIKTKVFTGAIKHALTETVDDNEPVWISDPVEFLAEYRYYVIRNRIVGYSQYDDGDYATPPDIAVVQSMVDKYTSSPVSYTLDVGIVRDQTVLIEVNDAWSIGLYPWGTMTTANYIELITARWQEILGVEE